MAKLGDKILCKWNGISVSRQINVSYYYTEKNESLWFETTDWKGKVFIYEKSICKNILSIFIKFTKVARKAFQ